MHGDVQTRLYNFPRLLGSSIQTRTENLCCKIYILAQKTTNSRTIFYVSIGSRLEVPKVLWFFESPTYAVGVKSLRNPVYRVSTYTLIGDKTTFLLAQGNFRRRKVK